MVTSEIKTRVSNGVYIALGYLAKDMKVSISELCSLILTDYIMKKPKEGGEKRCQVK